MHRVAVAFFSSETLMAQLVKFIQEKADLAHYPQLFVFILPYALLSCVGHYLEGRHRYIKQQLASSGSTLPGLQSFKIRYPEHAKLMNSDDYLNWISVQWRLHTSLPDLLDSCYVKSDYCKLEYSQRVAMVYGYDVASQFRKTDDLLKETAAWAKFNHKQAGTFTFAIVPFENQLVTYLKSRLETGVFFAIPSDLLALVNTDLVEVSTARPDAFIDPCFAQCSCTSSLVAGSVAFSVVDAEPGRRKIHRNNLIQKANSNVVVRVYSPMERSGHELPMSSTVVWVGWEPSGTQGIRWEGTLRELKGSHRGFPRQRDPWEPKGRPLSIKARPCLGRIPGFISCSLSCFVQRPIIDIS